MRHALILMGLGVSLVGLAAIRDAWWFGLAWMGMDFVALSSAHFLGLARILGKKQNGGIAWWSWVLFLPLHVLTYGIWHLARFLSRDAKSNRVTEDLTVGRRLLSSEVEDGFSNYVDLTSEFREPTRARGRPAYVSFPILDAGTPTAQELCAAIRKLRPGRTFVHCAQGRGRTGLFALAILLDSRVVTSVSDGLAMLRSARPGIRLNRMQLRCIEKFADEFVHREEAKI